MIHIFYLYSIYNENIIDGVKNVSLKARLEEIKYGKLKDIAGNNKLIVDGGHNISASFSIANWIKNQNEEVNLIVGMMKDKEHAEFVKTFENITGKRKPTFYVFRGLDDFFF